MVLHHSPLAYELPASYIFEYKSITCVVLTHPVETLASYFLKSMTCGMKWGNVHRHCVGWLPSE